jgi:methylase of polypeptide subunit release factors
MANPVPFALEDLGNMQREIDKYEPKSALVADDDGFHDIYIILEKASLFLKKDGFIALEINIGHAAILQKNMRQHSAKWKFPGFPVASSIFYCQLLNKEK